MRTQGSHSSEISSGAVRRLLLLAQILERHPEGLRAPELMERLGCSRRTIYRDIKILEDNGFPISQPERGRYCMLGAGRGEYAVHFSEAEARLLGKALEAISGDSILKDSLIRKLRPIGGLAGWLPEPLQPELAMILSIIEQAIAERRRILIQSYNSGRSGKIRDRLAEPFAILEHGTYIRAFDVQEGENRTFRISRMGRVVLLEDSWKCSRYHEAAPEPDVFGFTGPEWIPVQIVVKKRFMQIFREEYPGANVHAYRTGPEEWTMELKVKSWTGIGRFCLGLTEDVIHVAPEPFREYLRGRLAVSNLFL